MTGPNISNRLPRQPGEVIDRTRSLEFTWNGRAYQAFEGDTIVSALAAGGERVFSRSLKYRRPRGLFTATFHDPGCLLQVADEPNVRGAHRLVTGGMEVSAQAVWPSLRLDAKAANRLAGRFLSAGFYYKTFMRPKPLWPAYEAVLRRFVNAGAVSPSTPRHERDKRHAHPDVLVAGGGPAGLAAAIAAARAGARVMLAEEEHQLGGHLRWGGEAERAVLAELAAQVAAEPGIEVLLNAAVIGRYDGNLVAVLDRGNNGAESERLIRARAKTLVAAPGSPRSSRTTTRRERAPMAELDTSASAPAQGPDTPPWPEPVARSPITPAAPVTVVDGWEVSAIRADGAGLTLTDVTPLAKVAVASRQADLRGVRFGRAAREEDGTLVVGSGPGEWLLIGPPGQAPALAAAIGPDATWVDLTHVRALVRLTGHRGRDVLAKLSAIDLDDELVPDGAALRTAVAAVATDIIRDDHDGTRSYLLHCERSAGQYLLSSLLRAGAEYGLAVDGFRPAAQ